MFVYIVIEILLFEGRLVLAPAQRGTGSKRVNISQLKLDNQIKLELQI